MNKRFRSLRLICLALGLSISILGCKQEEEEVIDHSLAYTGEWCFSVREGLNLNINTAPDSFTYNGAIVPAFGFNRLAILYGEDRRVSLFIHFETELSTEKRYEAYSNWSGRFLTSDSLVLSYESEEFGPEHQIRINAVRI
jgi:hypothetical protein